MSSKNSRCRFVEIGSLPARAAGGKPNGQVKLWRAQWGDTQKNLDYIAKRKAIGEEATARLGVQCWG